MPKLPWLLVLRIFTLLALVSSAALLSDYAADAPSFCSATSGCGAVRASSYSHIKLGDGQFVPLPVFGVAGFAVLFAASLLSRRLLYVAAGLGGAVAAWLLVVQAFVLQQFCWLCVTTDVAAIVVAACAFGLSRQQGPDASVLLPNGTWWGLGLLALAAPLLWPFVKAAPAVPAPVLAHYKEGKLNVVEFADFQCPHCRRFHEIIKPVLQRYGDRVHFVRLNKPLDSHFYARDAARAAICGEQQGKAEATADALFKAQDLSPDGIDALAAAIGLDLKVFQACMLAPETNARIDRESAMLSGDEYHGLPTTYIGGKRLLGVRSAAELDDALERAARGEGVRGVAWFVYLPTVALLALLLVRFGLRRARHSNDTADRS